MGCGVSSVQTLGLFNNVVLEGRNEMVYIYGNKTQSDFLIIDLNENELQVYAGKAFDFPPDKVTIEAKIDAIFDYVRDHPAHPGSDAEGKVHAAERIKLYSDLGHQVKLGLSFMHSPTGITCRERAIMFHLLLAQIGVPTELVSSGDHLYVRYTPPATYKQTELIWDVQLNNKLNSRNYATYPEEQTLVIAKPKVLFK